MIGIGKSWITPDIVNFKDMLCQMQQEIMTRFKWAIQRNKTSTTGTEVNFERGWRERQKGVKPAHTTHNQKIQVDVRQVFVSDIITKSALLEARYKNFKKF